MEERNTEGNKNTVFVALSTLVLLIGVALGSVYLVKMGADAEEGLRGYLNNFAQTAAQGRDGAEIFKKALISNSIMLAVMFFAGFFRFGMIASAAVIARKGFIIGFTAASFMKCYGAVGILIMAAQLPALLAAVPAFLFYSAVSAGFSSGRRAGSSSPGAYILFTLIILAIFCAAAAAEGYLTTAIMKFLFVKINA